MIRRLYVHNFRCFENFELPIADRPSTLLIGKNGSGKTTQGGNRDRSSVRKRRGGVESKRIGTVPAAE